jgi:hypothetical protein
MDNFYTPEDNQNYLEDIPPLSVRFAARRAILNAITQAKITDRTYKPQKIFCKIQNNTPSSKYGSSNKR